MNAPAIPVTVARTVPGPAPTQRTRAAALADLRAAGWPSRRREQWRYTDLEPLATGSFDFATPVPSRGDLDAVRRLLAAPLFGAAERRLVLLDGQRVPGLGLDRLDGVELAEPEQRWSEFEGQFARQLTAARYPLAALNTAFTERGLWLRIPARTNVGAPLHIAILGSSRARAAAQPRMVIELEEGAEATLVQHFIDGD